VFQKACPCKIFFLYCGVDSPSVSFVVRSIFLVVVMLHEGKQNMKITGNVTHRRQNLYLNVLLQRYGMKL
jgi:hypothetical protein